MFISSKSFHFEQNSCLNHVLLCPFELIFVEAYLLLESFDMPLAAPIYQCAWTPHTNQGPMPFICFVNKVR